MATDDTQVPVEKVGGTQEEGPWPTTVDEIDAGEVHSRPVTLADESVGTVEVTVTDTIERGDGTAAVAFTYDDPTLDGGGTL